MGAKWDAFREWANKAAEAIEADNERRRAADEAYREVLVTYSHLGKAEQVRMVYVADKPLKAYLRGLPWSAYALKVTVVDGNGRIYDSATFSNTDLISLR